MYKENPKTKGSGIFAVIPQKGICPNICTDCFFQSGRSYLEPLNENTPNMLEQDRKHVIRVNDGNDSFFLSKEELYQVSIRYSHYFFNTSIAKGFEKYHNGWRKVPFVLTINPNQMTDKEFYKLDAIPTNLMFVRFRINYWNQTLAEEAIEYYSPKEIPIILTFMAYHKEEDIPAEYRENYIYRKRTLNSYYAITTSAFRYIMRRFEANKWVYSCGKIEGELGDTHCRFCGNCIREYFATMERLET